MDEDRASNRRSRRYEHMLLLSQMDRRRQNEAQDEDRHFHFHPGEDATTVTASTADVIHQQIHMKSKNGERGGYTTYQEPLQDQRHDLDSFSQHDVKSGESKEDREQLFHHASLPVSLSEATLPVTNSITSAPPAYVAMPSFLSALSMLEGGDTSDESEGSVLNDDDDFSSHSSA